MNRSDIIRAISAKIATISDSDAELSIKAILDILTRTLEIDDRIEIRGFGSFQTISVPERKVRNPRTGDTAIKPATKKVKFKPGKELKNRVNSIKH